MFGGQRKKSTATSALCLEPGAVVLTHVGFSAQAAPALTFAESRTLSAEGARQESLVDLVRSAGIAKHGCTLVMSLGEYQIIQLDLADIPAEEARQAARWQIGERIDYPSEDAVIDLFAVAPFGGERRPLNYAVVAQRALLQSRIEELAAAGVQLAAIDIPEFALRNVAELFVDDHRGVALLLLLEQSGLLVIVRDGVLYLSRQLSIGMKQLSATASSEASSAGLFDTIVLDIQRSFDYCESTFRLPTVSRLLIAQTGRELPALISYLNSYLTTHVEVLDLGQVMTLPPGIDRSVLHGYLPAIGGALRGRVF